ncbi:MAG: hypothetical protein AAF847_20495 [Bacteroidota bacterium]
MQQEKSFNECSLTFLEKTFHLEQAIETLPELEHWFALAKQEVIDRDEKVQLGKLGRLMEFNLYHWNETELDMNFIGPVFSLVNFSSKQFNLFAQRHIETTVEDYKLFGKPDNLVASGRREPEIPFFAFAEYKKKQDPKGDPVAQALAAMLVGQYLNHKIEETIYGCFVVGNDWQFMTLKGKSYEISKDYSAITDDIYDIFRMLKALKGIVQRRVTP